MPRNTSSSKQEFACHKNHTNTAQKWSTDVIMGKLGPHCPLRKSGRQVLITGQDIRIMSSSAVLERTGFI
jgi:hypothetical protein